LNERGLTVLRWVARGSSVLLVAVVLLMAVLPDPYREPRPLRLDEIVGLAFFPWGVLVGTLLAWRWPRVGGLIAVGSVVALYASQFILRGYFPFSAWLLLPLTPALLFLLLSFLEPRRATGG